MKLWRKTLDSGLLQHPTAWTVFGYILLNVSWEPSRYKTRYGIIQLEPGQMATGRKKMAAELSMGEQSVRTALGLLASMEIVTIRSTSTHSVITLKNWAKYQVDEKEQPAEKPTANQQLTTVKEVKEELPKTAAKAAGREFTDWYFQKHLEAHGQKPSPAVWVFKQADRHAKALGVPELIRRAGNYFADPWVTSHPLEDFIAAPDKWTALRVKADKTGDRTALDRKRTAL